MQDYWIFIFSCYNCTCCCLRNSNSSRSIYWICLKFFSRVATSSSASLRTSVELSAYLFSNEAHSLLSNNAFFLFSFSFLLKSSTNAYYKSEICIFEKRYMYLDITDSALKRHSCNLEYLGVLTCRRRCAFYCIAHFRCF